MSDASQNNSGAGSAAGNAGGGAGATAVTGSQAAANLYGQPTAGSGGAGNNAGGNAAPVDAGAGAGVANANAADNGTGNGGAAGATGGNTAGVVQQSGGTATGGATGGADSSTGKTDAAGQQGGGDNNAAAAVGAPEKYADFVIPEGAKVNDALMADLQATAKALNLNQEQAQSLVDLGAKQLAAITAAQQAAQEAQANEWRAAAEKDPEFGGAKLSEHIALAERGMNQFATPEFVGFLRESGLGNHPEMIRIFWKIGKATANDTFMGGGVAAGDVNMHPAHKLYGRQ
jgi:hypothetical protein